MAIGLKSKSNYKTAGACRMMEGREKSLPHTVKGDSSGDSGRADACLIKVLVVDDHPIFRRGLISLLEYWPELQVVGEAANGIEAVAGIEELQPDVVTMDVMMPEGNGVEATAAIQQILPRARVLLLTVSEENENLFKAMKAGARGYLLKSADLDHLITVIREVAAGDVIITPKMASRLMNDFEPGRGHQVDKEANEWSLRDKQVIQLVAQGSSIKEIGAELLVSETTVKAQLRTILEKFQIKDRPRAAVLTTV
jgi:two-component system NarL family response regulator